MGDLRERLPAQSLMEQTLRLQEEHGKVAPEAQSWYTGALGEIAVAGLLAWLGSGWTVLHSVPVGRSGADIDHVVIGQPGVFTLNTKSHVGQPVWVAGHGLLVSGRGTNYIGKAAAEAARAERLLSAASGLTVPVTPVVVLVSPGERTVKAPPENGVIVVSDAEVLSALQGRPIFSREQVERIVTAAVAPENWDAEPEADVDRAALALQFNAIMARAQQGVVSGHAGPGAGRRHSAPVPLPRSGAPSAETGSGAHLHARPALAGTASAAARTPLYAPHLVTSADRSRPSSHRRRKGDRLGNALARLVIAGFAIWVLLGGVLPALSP